jgi:para-nitrobenzyl esterase
MTSPIATTSYGRVRGERVASGAVWRGIPYATADRFERPQPVSPWSGDQDATTPGPQAPQLASILDQMLGPTGLPQSEACLTLNVWAPPAGNVWAPPAGNVWAPPAGSRHRGHPVLVWIHGGAFTNGTGSAPWYEGAAFARAGCVLVTLNYRLGAFGFLSAPGLDPAAGNLGLLDQIAALRWVRDEIGAFGGDPHDVTVFGESAGGLSVISLLTSPLAEGLFHRAWAMSPSLTQLRPSERARAVAAEVIEHAGLAPADLAGLRALPTERLLAAQGAVLRNGDPFTAFAPTPDGTVVPDAGVVDSITGAWGERVPLVLGTTRDEMALFMAFDPHVQGLDDAGLERRAQRVFGERTPAALTAYRLALPGAPPSRLAAAIATDHTFRMPATQLAVTRSVASAPTWMYWFTWPTPVFGGVLGSCHGIDIPFAFHGLDGTGVELFTGTGAERVAVADALHGAIVAFARHGVPGWPAYQPHTRPVWRIDPEPELLHDPDPGLRALYE